jgi:ATP-dependent Clp protease ATP-binding subunit ClpB
LLLAQRTIKSVLKEEGCIILFVDEIHLVLGAEKGESSMDAGSNLLKTMLSRLHHS